MDLSLKGIFTVAQDNALGLYIIIRMFPVGELQNKVNNIEKKGIEVPLQGTFYISCYTHRVAVGYVKKPR